jgi:uncharacterized phage protein (TIGR01671 family)
MREIKFRAWHRGVKEILSVGMIEFFKGDKPYRVNELNEAWHSDDIVIMQYIGLKDKNGKEIFEGDIVKCIPTTEYPTYGQLADIIFSNDLQWVARTPSTSDDFEYTCGMPIVWGGWLSIEVVGNIHENPELLKN